VQPAAALLAVATNELRPAAKRVRRSVRKAADTAAADEKRAAAQPSAGGGGTGRRAGTRSAAAATAAAAAALTGADVDADDDDDDDGGGDDGGEGEGEGEAESESDNATPVRRGKRSGGGSGGGGGAPGAGKQRDSGSVGGGGGGGSIDVDNLRLSDSSLAFTSLESPERLSYRRKRMFFTAHKQPGRERASGAMFERMRQHMKHALDSKVRSTPALSTRRSAATDLVPRRLLCRWDACIVRFRNSGVGVGRGGFTVQLIGRSLGRTNSPTVCRASAMPVSSRRPVRSGGRSGERWAIRADCRARSLRRSAAKPSAGAMRFALCSRASSNTPNWSADSTLCRPSPCPTHSSQVRSVCLSLSLSLLLCARISRVSVAIN
jgi:hypothetical protein